LTRRGPNLSARKQTAEGLASRAGSLPLVGGILALDFCNTASGRGTEGHREHLHTADDLLAWARHARVLDDAREAEMRRLCRDDAPFGRRLLARALRLRDAAFRLDAALARGEAPDQADMDAIAEIYSGCLARGTLTARDGGFGWTWRIETAPEEAVIGPIAASAMALLSAADHGRLKQCAGHHCGWLFLDTTKSNTRRWCEMEVCGNRAKQTRRRGRPASTLPEIDV
jgi:predicted RNA-binding Zn ribbon-like protein